MAQGWAKLAVGGLWMTACGTPTPTSLSATWFPNEQVGLRLGEMGVDGATPRWATLSVLNESTIDYTVDFVRLNGPAVALLETRQPEEATFGPRERWTVDVRVKPVTDDDYTGWTTAELEASVTVRLVGNYAVDEVTGQADPAQDIERVIEVPISGSINCDVDRDGFDDVRCGGADCDDLAPETNPATIEYCDLIDNNCDNVVDGLDCIPE